jgi:uncharacterized Zn finger protein (UPF0148 family)
MFCPKCGTLFERKGDELYCPKGDMHLSKNLEKGFMEVFIERTRTQVLKSFSFKVGGTWFCPSCGNQMLESEGIIHCANCDLNLNEFIVQLVELHSHSGNQK